MRAHCTLSSSTTKASNNNPPAHAGTTKGQTMTYNKMLYKKLQNMMKELNELIDQSHVFDAKYQQQLNDIYTKIDEFI